MVTKENYTFILDLDGTLYPESSTLQPVIYERTLDFIGNNIPSSDPKIIYDDVRTNGAMSLGLESKHGIARQTYFNTVWDINPADYIEENPELPTLLEDMRGKVALLTLSPSIWAVRVLAHLKVSDIFGDRVFTGEGNRRKPDPERFREVGHTLSDDLRTVFSIGDQETYDILPAKGLGMPTVLVSKNNLPTLADHKAPDIKGAITLLRNLGYIRK